MRRHCGGGLALAGNGAADAQPQKPFHDFSVAIYIPVFSTRQLADPQVLQQQFERIWSQVHFNKVYLEDYRSGVFADPAALDRIARFFRARGITVDGGLTLTQRRTRAGRSAPSITRTRRTSPWRSAPYARRRATSTP